MGVVCGGLGTKRGIRNLQTFHSPLRSDPANIHKVTIGGANFAKKENNVIGLTDAQPRAVAEDVDPELIRIGHEVVSRQKQETFAQAWRNHWGAGMWSLFLSCALFMEGYDTGLISTFYGMPQFQAKFGKPHNGKLVIPASYQGALLNLGKVGQLIGLIITGTCQERYGSKKTYI
ncbi:hypothetical protein I204_02518 [Kwoniella mangroviensis CBS 8886]|nr:hypothetical protein I204_02518 [Kwoniella mangroviensis CBS 8886]